MKPVRLLLPVFAAAALFAACGDDEPAPAAVVDGTEISEQSVVDELEAIAGNGDYLEALEASLEQSGIAVLGEGEDTFNSAFAAQVLSRQIQYTLVSNEVARREITIDDACEAAARDEVIGGLASFSDAGDGDAIYEAFPQAYRDQLVGWNAAVLALQGDLAEQPCVNEAAIEEYFETHREEFIQVCAHHILVATIEEAQAVEDELAAGGDFAAIATERSTDPGSGAQGGDLGCAAAGGYVAEFRDAVLSQDVGVVGPPVESQFGFHVIRVDSREDPELDDVRDQVTSALSSQVQSGFGEWFNNALSAAEVTVDSRYGTWDATNGQIQRPTGADESTETTAPGGATDETTTTTG